MPTYKRSAVTAKEGVNFIRSVVESGGSLFIKIEQESDLGIDALIEFVRNELPLNKQIAAQIKSGASYYTPEARECAFPIGDHRTYWSAHPLPVMGLVYVPALGAAFWVDIKSYLEKNPDATVIRFTAAEANRFDSEAFTKLFLPAVIGETPVLDFDEALRLARSSNPGDRYLGLLVLFRRFPNTAEVWDELVSTFRSRPADEIPSILLYWLAHIPGHGDILYVGETPNEHTKSHALNIFSNFEYDDVIKLLSFIDPEEQIGRGTLGQSVEAIISSLPSASVHLRRAIASQDTEMPMRESAALILAMNEGARAIPDLSALEQAGSWYAGEMIKHLKEYGDINPYE
ncbi:MAG TPA: DUF4365 domain-containing protein [Isosphaeraceae bacterium]